MENILDSLFPLHPNEGTLAYLIYKAVKSFRSQTFRPIGDNQTTYDHLDSWSNDIAAYLRGNGYHKNNVLFVQLDGTEAPFIVLLAGIKAGMTLIDFNDALAEITAGELFEKKILTFEKGFFVDAYNKTSFDDAKKIGEIHLFFNIPVIQENDIAFISIRRGAMDQKTISHNDALEMINNYSPELDIIPFIAFFYCFKNNLQCIDELQRNNLRNKI